MNTALAATARHILQFIAGILIARGILDNDAAAKAVDYTLEAVGALISLGTLVWMLRSKSKTPAPKVATTTAGTLAALFLGLALLPGCSAILPGHDPVVVNAERTTTATLSTFDAFLQWELDNRETLAAVPEIRKVADKIRDNGQTWLRTARNLTRAYKANRTPENKASLDTALAVLGKAVQEAQRYLALQTSP